MKKPKRKGTRHRLLVSYRIWSRWSTYLLLTGILLLGLWWIVDHQIFSLQIPFGGLVIFSLGIVITVLGLFCLVVKQYNYVQPYAQYVLLVTPLLRLKISYRRIKSIRASELTKLFPPSTSSNAIRHNLEPFYGITASTIALNSLPVSKRWLSMFLPKGFLLERENILCLVVPDWMKLNTELDSFLGAYRDRQSHKGRAVHAFKILSKK